MAKGAETKQIITEKILEIFDGAFLNGKELRIPYIENGERVEIKVALICAKVNIGDEVSFSSTSPTANINTITQSTDDIPPWEDLPVAPQDVELTEDEKATVDKLLSALNY